MKLSLELKGIILGTVSGLAAIGIAIAAGEMLQRRPTAAAAAAATATAATTRTTGAPAVTEEPLAVPPAGTLANQGYQLFLLNCAHCHGNDARGDEGPDLHGVTKSDARIASMIKNGVKGEMPKFGSKFQDADIHALIAFLRTLKE